MVFPETERALLHRLATEQREGRAPSIAAAVVGTASGSGPTPSRPPSDTQFRIGPLPAGQPTSLPRNG